MRWYPMARALFWRLVVRLKYGQDPVVGVNGQGLRYKSR
jgi:hypothetical protein